MHLRIGTSTDEDVARAARAAAAAALAGATSPVFAFVFATFHYDPDLLARELTQALGELPWAGSVTLGVLAGRELLERGLAVGVVEGGVRAGVGVGEEVSRDPRRAGREAVSAALADMPLPSANRTRALVLITDTLSGSPAEVLRGAVEVAGAGLAWAGGGTGDNLHSAPAAQFARGRAHRDSAVAIALDCGTRVGTGIHHGWRPYGPQSMVTRAAGAVVRELEYESAFDVYRAVAATRGDAVDRESFATFAMTHPLGIPQAGGDYLIRDPLSVDSSGALRCVAEVPDGALVRVMHGSIDMVVDAPRVAAGQARNQLRGGIGGALVFDCVSRYLMLGARSRTEVAACQEALGTAVPLLGCLSFGEVGSFGAQVPQFHNKTVVVLGLPA